MASPFVHLVGLLARRLRDPFGFDHLDGITLQPSDLPTLSRDARLDGAGH